MSCLLFLFNEVGENVTDVITVVATVLLAALLLLALVFCWRKNFKTKEIVYAGVALATSFVLSCIKIKPVAYGGSITLASLVPIIWYAFTFGFSRGLLTGIIYGILQFVESPYILTPATFLLDYVLPFSCICLAPLAKKVCKNEIAQIILATVFVYIGRFTMHFLSGVIFFELGAVWAELPANTSITYSLLYQTVYLVPDFLISAICLTTLTKTGVTKRLMPKTNAD